MGGSQVFEGRVAGCWPLPWPPYFFSSPRGGISLALQEKSRQHQGKRKEREESARATLGSFPSKRFKQVRSRSWGGYLSFSASAQLWKGGAWGLSSVCSYPHFIWGGFQYRSLVSRSLVGGMGVMAVALGISSAHPMFLPSRGPAPLGTSAATLAHQRKALHQAPSLRLLHWTPNLTALAWKILDNLAPLANLMPPCRSWTHPAPLPHS